ncbi:hypothetical protein RUND412_000055 [Rhizina undulata]
MAHLYDAPVTGLESYEDDSMLGIGLPPPSPLLPRQGEEGKPDGAPPAGGGIGSLADELAGAMYDSEEEEFEEGGVLLATDDSLLVGTAPLEIATEGLNGTDVNGVTSPKAAKRGLEGVGIPVTAGDMRAKNTSHYHQRPPTASDYDGSEYGDPEDLDNGISLGLEDKITQIERLAARKMMLKEEEKGEGELAGVIPRVMEGLQKLYPQTSIETGSSRLITAHGAVSSHMMRQTRMLRDLSFAISSSTLPPDDTSDLLLSLIDLIPRPTLQPLSELTTLHSLSLSLISQLSFISDSLHMARQSSIAATRKLRVAKEACADWKNELEAVEKARRWIEEGDWEGRCRRREAAGVCAEVTGGFEDVCNRFEERLRAQLVTA